MDLYHRSIDIILKNQSETGSYVASPNFPSYAFCWLRDGSFIAHAMNQVGEHESAKNFFRWVDRAIQRYSWKVEQVLQKLEQGERPDEKDFLHTRYTIGGEEADVAWWNFQLDGYGTWLWALARYVEMTSDTSLITETADCIRLTVLYLSALWQFPNYDCWEEHPTYIHPYTLAAIYAGLIGAQKLEIYSPHLLGNQMNPHITDEIRHYVRKHGVWNGCLAKSFLPAGKDEQPNNHLFTSVDASLIGVATPYRLFPPKDPIFRNTLERIERDLHCQGGGVHRYLADTYYGGGEWVLLAAWLGWYYSEIDAWTQAGELLNWVEAQTDESGYLPEQVSSHLLAPDCYAEWENRWGPIANPLLWSHAMYLILHQAIEARK